MSSRPGPPSDAELSPREREILDLIARGLSNAEITERLYISINTLKTYIRTAYDKIGVHSRVQAVLWGLRHGLGDGTLGPTSPSDETETRPS